MHQELGQPTEALPLLRRSLERSAPTDSIVRKLYALIAHCHRQLGQQAEALSVCREGRRGYPEDVELLFHEANVLHMQGDLPAAETCLLRLLEGRDTPHVGSIDAGLRGYKARHNLAVIYRQQGRDADAEVQWRAAVAEAPHFAPSWLGLGELLLSQQRWPELEQLRARLGDDLGLAVEAGVFQAREHLARREFVPARQVLEHTIARAPKAVWPRVILSHALLQEGSDWHAAEQALRDVLDLDPSQSEARSNLAVLLRSQNNRAQEHPAAGSGLAGLKE